MDEICDAQLYIASKIAFCWYNTHGCLGRTSLLNPYAVQDHETRHDTGLRKLLLNHLYFSTYRAFHSLCLRIPYAHGPIQKFRPPQTQGAEQQLAMMFPAFLTSVLSRLVQAYHLLLMIENLSFAS